MRKILKKATRDAERLLKSARVVLDITNGGCQLLWNEMPEINVLAVIGPTSLDEGRPVILEEIGLWRTRPFTEGKLAKGRVGDSGARCIASRANFFFPTPEQYEQVAPTIFFLLQEMVDVKTSEWKRGPHDPIWLWSPHNFYSRKSRKLRSGVRVNYWPRGLRFSVRSNSELLLSDIYWAELNLNKSLQNHLLGLARFISLHLSRYRSSWRGRVDFCQLKGVQDVAKILAKKNLPDYYLSEMMSYLPDRNKNWLWFHLCDLIGWHGENHPEKEKSLSALPNPKQRLGDIQLKVTTGIDKNKNHVAFEVFPDENNI